MDHSCGKCNNPDDDYMVACDSCEVWYHLDCVSESPGVAERDFVCFKCTVKKEKRGKGKADATVPIKFNKSRVSKGPKPSEPEGNYDQSEVIPDPNQKEKETEYSEENYQRNKSDLSNRSESNELRRQAKFERLEEEMLEREKQYEHEKALNVKRLELEEKFQRKKLDHERELRQRKLDQQREMYRIQLMEEADFVKQQTQFQTLRSKLQTSDEKTDNMNTGADGVPATCSRRNLPVPEIQETPRCIPNSKLPVPTKLKEMFKHDGSASNGSEEERLETSEEELDIEPEQTPSNELKVKFQKSKGSAPTKAQIAARQVMTKKLPVFSGRVEEWPIFFSSYTNSTEACGFTDVENLVRLQESLKGPALESVRSRLLLPKAVPQVIDTLRMLYGRPEQLIHTLLNKVRRTESPRADRLETFIPFALAVQELCDHLEAAELYNHLMNPILIQELVDKLPAATKREWVHFKRASVNTTLRTFADFASGIVSEASEVILAVDLQGSSKPDKSKMKDKGFIHAHSDATAPPPFSPCRVCKTAGHRTRNCEEFRRLSLGERVKMMERLKLCERCLNEHTGWCRFKITCNVGNCRLQHHPLVHREAVSNPRVDIFDQGQLHTHLDGKVPVIFRIVPIKLHNGSRTITTVAYLDEGFSMTLVEENILRELGIHGNPQPLTLQWTGNIVRRESSSECVSLQVESEAGHRLDLKDAHTVKKLYLPKQRIDFHEISNQYQHLRGVLATNHIGTAEPKVLIGLNNAHLLAPLESRVGNVNEPIAVRSQLGWTIYGPRENQPSTGIVGYHGGYTNEELHEKMRVFFMTQEPKTIVSKLPESAADRRARELLETTTVKVGDRFETGLLWNTDDVNLPDSYNMAYKRLQGLERRLLKDPELHEKVKQKIEDYLAKGYAHKATSEELATADPKKIWHLPLSVVVNPKKPEKIRLVLDAAAQVDGVSLNSMLLVGPDLLTTLDAVVQKFRERQVAFGGDIREMYHQFRMKTADKNFLRFLFRSNPSANPETYLMDVAIFGSACSPASAQYIKNLNASQYANRFPEALSAIVHKHYVDDYLDCSNTTEEAVERAQQVRYIHRQAGLEIRNWVSNSKAFLEAMGEITLNEEVSLNSGESELCERVLGIIW
ncbi:uncharacterized protein LOC129766141 [Toxorhynchites rutilus septentrionalis]|uniref:uncharacterized protein LOC129766141 n=1 Tax=Toxorhynchites rutilus septentrionalis TaxID=329112 RepID=UPI0024786B75|nr:uncharacterized protein LOC129766141 [Toxorhynchites rutilus septentrionalis]